MVELPPKRKEDNIIENKRKEIKNKRKENNKDFVSPSLEDIKKYVLEKNLKVSAEQFYNYFTEGNWKDSNGKQVKNWKQKILTWNGYAEKDMKEDKQEKQEEIHYVENTMSEEEYFRKLRGENDV